MAESTEPEITFIDYHAPWCGPCRAMEPVLEELKGQYAGKIKFEEVNVDEESERANKAGVMSIPTFHIVKAGKVFQTLIGYQAKEELEKQFKAALS